MSCEDVKTFRVGQVLTQGDLTLYVTDPSGTLFISPFQVTYALYRLFHGAWQRVGPEMRQAVLQRVGEYHAVTSVGDLTQPGDWQIVWSFRRSFDAPVEQVTCSFKVVDAVSSPIEGDTTCRKTKYGWS